MHSYKIIPFNIETHKKALISLWEENLSGSSEERFNWLYNQNPYGKVKTLLAQNTKGEIVGCASLYPNNLYIEGREYITWTGNDFAIRKDCRVFGPAILLQKALIDLSQKDKLDFTFAFPNAASTGVFKRIGFKEIGAAKCWSRPLISKNKFLKKNINHIASLVFAFFIDTFLRGFDWGYSFLHFRRFIFKVRVSSDSQFDVFWEKSKKNYKITTVRSSNYLNWRYTDHVKEKYSYFCAYNKDNELSGYIIYTIIENVALVADVFTSGINSDFDYLIIEFCRAMRKKEIEAVTLSFLENTELIKRLRKLLFFKSSGVRFYYNKMSICGDFLCSRDRWIIYDGDMDI